MFCAWPCLPRQVGTVLGSPYDYVVAVLAYANPGSRHPGPEPGKQQKKDGFGSRLRQSDGDEGMTPRLLRVRIPGAYEDRRTARSADGPATGPPKAPM